MPLRGGGDEPVRLGRARVQQAVDVDVLTGLERRQRPPVTGEPGGAEGDRIEVLVLEQLVEVPRPRGRRAVADARGAHRVVADPAQRRLRELVERPRERVAQPVRAADDTDGDGRPHRDSCRRSSARPSSGTAAAVPTANATATCISALPGATK